MRQLLKLDFPKISGSGCFAGVLTRQVYRYLLINSPVATEQLQNQAENQMNHHETMQLYRLLALAVPSFDKLKLHHLIIHGHCLHTTGKPHFSEVPTVLVFRLY